MIPKRLEFGRDHLVCPSYQSSVYGSHCSYLLYVFPCLTFRHQYYIPHLLSYQSGKVKILSRSSRIASKRLFLLPPAAASLYSLFLVSPSDDLSLFTPNLVVKIPHAPPFSLPFLFLLKNHRFFHYYIIIAMFSAIRNLE